MQVDRHREAKSACERNNDLRIDRTDLMEADMLAIDFLRVGFCWNETSIYQKFDLRRTGQKGRSVTDFIREGRSVIPFCSASSA